MSTKRKTDLHPCKCGCGELCLQTYKRGHNPTMERSGLSTLHIRGPINKRQRPRGKPKIDPFIAENGQTYEEMCAWHREQRDRVMASLTGVNAEI